MTAGLASLTSYIYDPTLDGPEYSYFKAISWKGAAITLAAVCTSLVAKPLKGRIDLSFNAAAKFGMVEFVVAAILTKATKTPLQHKHHYYTTHPKEWHTLKKDERTELVKEFYEAGLPAISLWGNPINNYDCFDNYEDLQTNLESYSPAQLSWYRELLQKEGFPDQPTERHNGSWAYPAPHQFYFNFMLRCQQTGIATLRWTMNHNHLNYLKDKPELIEMLYQEFSQTPLYRCYCQSHIMYWDDAFLSQDKDPFPSLVKVMEQLNPSKVKPMDADHLRMWYGIFAKQQSSWEHLSESIQFGFLIQFFELGYQPFMKFHNFPESFIVCVNARSTEDMEQLNPMHWAGLIQHSTSQGKMAFQHVYALNKKIEDVRSQYRTKKNRVK